MNKEEKKKSIKYIMSGIGAMTALALMATTGAFMVGKAVKDLRDFTDNQEVKSRSFTVDYKGEYIPDSSYVGTTRFYTVPYGYELVGDKALKIGSDPSNPDNYVEATENVLYSVPEGFKIHLVMGARVPEEFITLPEGYDFRVEIKPAIREEKNGKITYKAQEGGILVGNKSLRYFIVEKTKTRTMK